MKKIILMMGVAILLFGLILTISPLLVSKMRANHIYSAMQGNFCSMELTPGEIPGNFWEKHRYYLETPTIYNGSPFFVIQDSKSGEMYYWSRLGDLEGHTRFSVLTRFALFYPDWDSSQWVLLYRC